MNSLPPALSPYAPKELLIPKEEKKFYKKWVKKNNRKKKNKYKMP